MYPVPQLGHLNLALPPDATAVSLPTAVTTLPTHHRPPHVGIDLPEHQESDLTTTVVYITPSSSTAAPPTTTALASMMDSDSDNGECRLLGPFALLVQLALGGLALLSLVYKRWRERPQRPLKVWWFDVSKQVVGSVLVHMANVFMSMLTSGGLDIKLAPSSIATRMAVELAKRGGDEYTPNPCSLYLLNLAIDTTLGIPILIILIRVYTAIVALTPLGKPRESIQSGNYGHPPNAVWWLKQSFIYFCGLFGMKICVLIIFLMLPWISRIGDWALKWTEGNERLQIVFVMMLFPLIMNALQYYIIDSFIMLKEEATDGDDSESEEAFLSSEGRTGSVYEGVRATSSSDGEDEISADDDLIRKNKMSKKSSNSTVTVSRRKDSEDHEYDPAVDGDSQTVIGSSSSRTGPTGRAQPLSEELYPKE